MISPLEPRLRKVGYAHVTGSVHLIKLIFGHGLDVSSMAGQSAATAVHRFCQVSRRNLLDWNQSGGLSCRGQYIW